MGGVACDHNHRGVACDRNRHVGSRGSPTPLSQAHDSCPVHSCRAHSCLVHSCVVRSCLGQGGGRIQVHGLVHVCTHGLHCGCTPAGGGSSQGGGLWIPCKTHTPCGGSCLCARLSQGQHAVCWHRLVQGRHRVPLQFRIQQGTTHVV